MRALTLSKDLDVVATLSDQCVWTCDAIPEMATLLNNFTARVVENLSPSDGDPPSVVLALAAQHFAPATAQHQQVPPIATGVTP